MISFVVLFLTLAGTLVGSAGAASAVVPMPSCKSNPSIHGTLGSCTSVRRLRAPSFGVEP
ncbi:exported hypothetical protein [Frankia sp. AgKG'84/4]